MKTAREFLAHLGIDESHPGPFTFQELHDAVEKALGSEPEIYSPEWVQREQAKGNAFLRAPAAITPTSSAGHLSGDFGPLAGMPFRIVPYDPNQEEQPPF